MTTTSGPPLPFDEAMRTPRCGWGCGRRSWGRFATGRATPGRSQTGPTTRDRGSAPAAAGFLVRVARRPEQLDEGLQLRRRQVAELARVARAHRLGQLVEQGDA